MQNLPGAIVAHCCGCSAAQDAQMNRDSYIAAATQIVVEEIADPGLRESAGRYLKRALDTAYDTLTLPRL